LNALFGMPSASTPLLVNALLGLDEKPRNRSEWEARFAHWQRPASRTEEERIAATTSKITRALKRSTLLATRQWRIIPQGSHHNNTNVRSESDVDMAVCLMDAYFVGGPPGDQPTMGELGHEPLPFTYEQYKEHIAGCLEAEFGSAAIRRGNKSIHVHKDDDDKINADVVAAFTCQLYGPALTVLGGRSQPTLGIGLGTMTGELVTNFPEQHYANGCAKNDRVGRRYKRVVRILKRLRDHMAANTVAPLAVRLRAQATASFLIECLVYNCPDRCFQNSSIFDDVVEVLAHLSYGLTATGLHGGLWFSWKEVNGVKDVFGPAQAWTAADGRQFVGHARAYLEV
jgi:hypothetical protein